MQKVFTIVLKVASIIVDLSSAIECFITKRKNEKPKQSDNTVN